MESGPLERRGRRQAPRTFDPCDWSPPSESGTFEDAAAETSAAHLVVFGARLESGTLEAVASTAAHLCWMPSVGGGRLPCGPHGALLESDGEELCAGAEGMDDLTRTRTLETDCAGDENARGMR